MNQESYKLDHIAYVELGERKLDYTEYDTMADFYKSDFQKFMEYNLRDVELVDRLEDKPFKAVLQRFDHLRAPLCNLGLRQAAIFRENVIATSLTCVDYTTNTS